MLKYFGLTTIKNQEKLIEEIKKEHETIRKDFSIQIEQSIAQTIKDNHRHEKHVAMLYRKIDDLKAGRK